MGRFNAFIRAPHDVTYPTYSHDPIDMRRVTSFEEIEKIGDFYYDENCIHIGIAVPSEQEPGYQFVWIPIAHRHEAPGYWYWSGNRDKPTLKPSLGVDGHWHGYVNAGQLVEA